MARGRILSKRHGSRSFARSRPSGCHRAQGSGARRAAGEALSSAALNIAEGIGPALRAAEACGYIALLPPSMVADFDRVIGTLVKNVTRG